MGPTVPLALMGRPLQLPELSLKVRISLSYVNDREGLSSVYPCAVNSGLDKVPVIVGTKAFPLIAKSAVNNPEKPYFSPSGIRSSTFFMSSSRSFAFKSSSGPFGELTNAVPCM